MWDDLIIMSHCKWNAFFKKKTLTTHLNSSYFSKTPLSTALGSYSLLHATQRATSDGQKYGSISIFCTDRVAYPAKDAKANLERRLKLPVLKFRWDLKLNIHLIKKIPLLLPTFSNLQNHSAPFYQVVQFWALTQQRSPLSSYSSLREHQ